MPPPANARQRPPEHAPLRVTVHCRDKLCSHIGLTPNRPPVAPSMSNLWAGKCQQGEHLPLQPRSMDPLRQRQIRPGHSPHEARTPCPLKPGSGSADRRLATVPPIELGDWWSKIGSRGQRTKTWAKLLSCGKDDSAEHRSPRQKRQRPFPFIFR